METSVDDCVLQILSLTFIYDEIKKRSNIKLNHPLEPLLVALKSQLQE